MTRQRPKPFNTKNLKQAFRNSKPPEGALENAADMLQTLRLNFTDAKDDNEVAELLIMDVIGEDWWTGGGVTGEDVVKFLDKNSDKDILVRMDSGGGDVYDGVVIFNALVQHEKNVEVIIEGLAFSAASYIALAGDVVKMQATANFGIHASSSGCYGNANSMTSMAEWLRRIDTTILDIYEARGSAEREELEEWLKGIDDDGTLFSAAEALDSGFIDEIIPIPKKETKKETKDDRATGQRPDNKVTVSFPADVDESEITIRHRKTPVAENDVLPVVDVSEKRIAAASAKREATMARIAARNRQTRVSNIKKQVQPS